MPLLLVLHQLVVVLHRLMCRAGLEHELSVGDLRVLAWLRTEQGTSCSRMAERLQLSRQQVQRTLEQLERRHLVERYDSVFTRKTVGWALTGEGERLFECVAEDLRRMEVALERRPAFDALRLAQQLQLAIEALMGVSNSRNGPRALFAPPPEETTPDWDP